MLKKILDGLYSQEFVEIEGIKFKIKELECSESPGCTIVGISAVATLDNSTNRKFNLNIKCLD